MGSKKYSWQNKHPDWTDEELIDAYLKGNDATYIGELFGRYVDLIFGLCLKHLKDVHNSEDTAYEIFEILIKKLQTNTVTHFKSWLYRLASNYCIDKLRKNKNSQIIHLEDKFESVRDVLDYNDTLEKEALLQKIDFCLGTLNEEQKKCIDLFYFQEKTYQDIALTLDISWSSTRSYIQNGKRNLKICMEKNDDRRI
jgi:RNA polymerase sigma-70 factor (ECF subfamily)